MYIGTCMFRAEDFIVLKHILHVRTYNVRAFKKFLNQPYFIMVTLNCPVPSHRILTSLSDCTQHNSFVILSSFYYYMYSQVR